MRIALATLLVTVLLAGAALAADGQPQPQQIVLTIMTPQVNNLAPGIDAAVAVTPEQANALAAVYREVFQSSAVTLANMVLQDGNTTMAQRQMAAATLQQAQGLFQARARAVFTGPQRTLVDKVQAAYDKAFQDAQAQLQAALKSKFTAELETILNAEQKAAMLKARAEIEAANKKAAEQQKTTTTPPATAPK